MSQKTQTPKTIQVKQEARIEYITKHMLFKTQEELAKDLKVSRKTIGRDLTSWYDTNGFKDFILAEFLENYGKAKLTEKPIKLLDRIITMFKHLPPQQQHELEEQIKISFNLPQKYNLKTTKKTNKKGGVSYTQEAELKKIDLEDKEKEEES